jgi:hypothetical protein
MYKWAKAFRVAIPDHRLEAYATVDSDTGWKPMPLSGVALTYARRLAVN